MDEFLFQYKAIYWNSIIFAVSKIKQISERKAMLHRNVFINIRKIVRSLNLESKRIQKEYGVSIPQLLCLTYLSEQENYQSTVTKLSKYLNLNLSTMTGIINRLEKKGLVARLPKAADKRVTPVTITSRGSKMLKDSPDLIHDQLSRKLKQLPEEDLKHIDRALSMLVNYLEIEEVSASSIITIDEPIISIEEPGNDK
ncbi:MAG: MarR family transcriptional regulator [Bacteroidales bacterium]|nr:MarR family transcriptional regulator [Bacteroidales bacterium]